MLSQSGLNKLHFSKVGYRWDFMKPLRKRLLLSYYIMIISRMAANMAAVTLKLAYLLNYLLQISKQHVKVGAVKIFDTNLIYSRVIGLHASGRDIAIKDVFGHELAPVPTSMFDDTGDMRIAKSKSTLKNILQVEVSDRVAGGANVSVLDGSAIPWIVPWPADGSVQDYIANFKYTIGNTKSVPTVIIRWIG